MTQVPSPDAVVALRMMGDTVTLKGDESDLAVRCWRMTAPRVDVGPVHWSSDLTQVQVVACGGKFGEDSDPMMLTLREVLFGDGVHMPVKFVCTSCARQFSVARLQAAVRRESREGVWQST
jgi:hypothetical protein